MHQISLRVPQSGIPAILLWMTKHPLSELECELQHSGLISQNLMASQTQKQLKKEMSKYYFLIILKKIEIKTKPRRIPTEETQSLLDGEERRIVKSLRLNMIS